MPNGCKMYQTYLVSSLGIRVFAYVRSSWFSFMNFPYFSNNPLRIESRGNYWQISSFGGKIIIGDAMMVPAEHVWIFTKIDCKNQVKGVRMSLIIKVHTANFNGN